MKLSPQGPVRQIAEILYHCSHCRYEFRRVLIVRVHHDYDVSARIQCQPVACFLIGSYLFVVLVHLNSNCRETLGHSNGIISTSIVDNNHLVDDLLVHHLFVGLPECLFGIAGRRYTTTFCPLNIDQLRNQGCRLAAGPSHYSHVTPSHRVHGLSPWGRSSAK